MSKKGLFIACLLCWCAFGLRGQEHTSVYVQSDGPIQEVEIFLSQSNRSFNTDKNGRVSIEDLASPEVAWFYKLGFAYKLDTIYPGKENVVRLHKLQQILDEVVISDLQSTASLSESVLQVRKISSEQIEAQSAQNIEQALSHQAMFRSNRDNALQMNSMKIMGLGGENLKILIDGVPMIGRMLGNLDLSEVSSNSIEAVEIIEGPMSVIYGSNALAGAVNIVTSSGLNKKRSLKAHSYLDGNGSYNFGGAAEHAFGKNAVSLSAGRNFFEGWNAGERSRGWTWLPKEQYYANLKLSRQSKHWNLNLSSRLSDSYLLDRGEPILPYGEQAIDREFTRLRADQLLSVEYDSRKKLNARLMLHKNHFRQIKNSFSKDLTTLNQQLIPDPAEQDTQRFNAEGMKLISNYLYSKKTRFLLGIDANQESLTGARISEGIQKNTELASYASYEQRIKTSTLRIGLRKGLMNENWTPWIIAIQGRIPITDNLIMRASYGRAYRIASIKESYLNFIDSNHEVYGNSELKPEDGDSYQVKFTQLLKHGKYQGSLDANFFYNDISNKIELVTLSPLEATYQNIGNFKSQGMTLAYHWLSNALDWRLDYNIIGVDYGNGLEYSNRLSNQLMYKLKKTQTSFSVFGSMFFRQYISLYNSETGELERIPQASYSMLDAQVAQSFFKKRLKLSAGVRNILDVTQVLQSNAGATHGGGNASSFISNGRNYFINASIDLFK